jgi:N-acetylmuramoyl-L-alanine amidase
VSRKIKERQGIDMTGFKKQNKPLHLFYWALVMFWGVLAPVCGTIGSAWAASGHGRVIVLDPGHGGYDQGAGTRAGAYEKEITLKLALAAAEALRPDYRVVLTRTGDYHLDLTGRAAIANRQRADLFISLHVGGSRQKHASAWGIYTHGDHQNTAGRRHTDSDGPFQALGSEDDKDILWQDIQPRHATAARNLAGRLKSQFQSDPRIPVVEIRQAPLRVLQGVDAPAVVLEVGHLTSPAARDGLTDPRYISDLANHIRQAVEAYFQAKN